MNRGFFPFINAVASLFGKDKDNHQEKLNYIAIDVLHPVWEILPSPKDFIERSNL